VWLIYFTLTGIVWPWWLEPLIPTHSVPYAAIGFALYGGILLYVFTKNTLPYLFKTYDVTKSTIID